MRELVMLAVLGAVAGGAVAPQAPVVHLSPPTAAQSFPQQWAYVASERMFNTVCCSRRAGKTRGAVLRACRVLAEKPGSWVHFGSLIRRNARKHFWRPLLAQMDRLGWDYRANETEMIAELPNGSWVQAFGCDDLAGTKAVQGDRSSLFIIDECHLPNDAVLRELVAVAEPMLTDTGGMMDLLGLPPEAEPCFFSEKLDNAEWAHFHWTMFDHDHPDSREVKRERVGRIIKSKKLTWEHPVIRRAYFGERGGDPEKKAYEYVDGRNEYNPFTVDFTEDGWRHATGLDLGFQDHDAIVTMSWRVKDPRRQLYVRFRWQRNHLDVDDIAGVMDACREVYRGTTVGDHGGHGAVKTLASIKKRVRCTMQPKPPDVMVSVGLVNDDLRTSRLLLPICDLETDRVLAAHDKLVKSGKKRNGQPRDAEVDKRVRTLIEMELGPEEEYVGGGAAPLAKELGQVTKEQDPKDPSKVRINKKGFHSDLSEALRYGHHAARHWSARAPEAEKDHDQERIERIESQERKRRDIYGV